ncbi:double-stranded RNA-binding protein 4-like [Phaseolus vulgaris]|uniref:double-stranded RNA-binding protein 4-like n=1 Tax=Phaseolus vulgaris TaxID=3885 RepID=UPI0035CC29C6
MASSPFDSAPSLPAVPVSVPVLVPVASQSPEQLMHKNRLQEFAQRYNIALPLYQSNNEGQQHAPRFRSKVWVDGMSYISQSTFSHRKTAEQDAARLALKCLSKRTRDEAPSLDCEVCCCKIFGVGVGVDFSRYNFS